jgi:uncharacterized delta-60 repeat protein
VVLDPDGKLTLGGYATRPGGLDVFAIDRFLANGNLDNPQFAGTFAHSEAAFPGASGARATAIARQPDGRYVLAGFANVGGVKRVALARFNAAGGLDSSFGTGGMTTLTIGASSADDVLVQPDGKIVIAGSANLGAGAEVLLARLLPSGVLDRGFGGDGFVLTTVPGSAEDAADGLTRLADGRLLVVGTDRSATGESRYLVLRYGSATACTILLGCPIVLVKKASATIMPDLTSPVGVGILVHRILGKRHVLVGRVPFGPQRAGAKPIRWNLKVSGQRLKPGRYIINVRALRGSKVLTVSHPITIVVR